MRPPNWKFDLLIIGLLVGPIVMSGSLISRWFFSHLHKYSPMVTSHAGAGSIIPMPLDDQLTHCFEADQSKCKFGPDIVNENGENAHPGSGTADLLPMERSDHPTDFGDGCDHCYTVEADKIWRREHSAGFYCYVDAGHNLITSDPSRCNMFEPHPTNRVVPETDDGTAALATRQFYDCLKNANKICRIIQDVE